METKTKIAYFSAEIGISAKLPTYSGGLGVLAGDHIKAAADAEIPMCAVTLLYKEGYFKQRIDDEGRQTEIYPQFDPHPLLKKLPIKFTLPFKTRPFVICTGFGLAVMVNSSVIITTGNRICDISSFFPWYRTPSPMVVALTGTEFLLP